MLRKVVFAFGAVLSICSITLSPLATAEQSGKVYRIGVLGAGTAAQYAHRMEVFRLQLRELGWINKRAIKFDERWADERYERPPRLAAELVALKVDLIFVTGGTPAVEAAMKTTLPATRSLRSLSRAWRILAAISPGLR